MAFFVVFFVATELGHDNVLVAWHRLVGICYRLTTIACSSIISYSLLILHFICIMARVAIDSDVNK